MLTHVAQTSSRVAETRRRLEKIELLASCIRRLDPRDVALGVAFLAGEPRQGKIGIGYATLRALRVAPTVEPVLTLSEVDATFGRIAETTGRGSTAARAQLLAQLFTRATAAEQEFLSRLLLQQLRQGALEGLIVDAIAKAAGVAPASVRRAFMLTGDLPSVARGALTGGEAGLAEFAIRLFRPVRPMLAQTAEEVAEALQLLQQVALEFKMDGARIQVHKSGADVRIFTRSLHDVTVVAPEIVQAVRDFPARQLILDGEALVLRGDGKPRPFQTTMRRFGRKLDVDALRESFPLSPFFFDVLHADGHDLIDRPGKDRVEVLVELVPEAMRIPRVVTAKREDGDRFLARALEQGHEGIMAKSLVASYEAGSRGKGWLKVKPDQTLDLVVLAAEWGSGRRQGWLSNLHLGARDTVSGQFVMLGKTFKGMTDAVLEWQTKRLQQIETHRDAHTVYVRPELVVEIAFNEIQESPHYAARMALRFARLKRYRPDKQAAEADTLETVRTIHLARQE